ncbi:MAG TPA: ABC transporter permease [Anaerolineae bacterium]|nr:ABC transporter permease [Anaerolineae bacterium]
MTTSSKVSAMTSLGQSNWLAHWHALAAVIRREWIVFTRYPTWIVALVIWPVIFPAAYILSARALAGPDGSGLAVFNQSAGTGNYLGFIAIGTTVWMWQNVVLWNVGFALRNDQLHGTLESNWLSPTWRFSFLLGSSVTQLVTMLMFLLISGIEFVLLFGVRFDGNLLLVAIMFVAAIPAIYGLGFAFASLVITIKEANAFVFLVRGIVMIFCGITFPLSVLPAWMQNVAAWLPQTYLIRGVRNAALSGADLPALLPDLGALLLFGIAWLTIGYVTFNWMERRARQTGAIGQY